MSSLVDLPRRAVTRFDLPEVCLATGMTEGVRYRPATFVFVPLWARFSVVFCGLIGILAMVLSMKRVRMEVPFTDVAYSRWVSARRMAGVLVAAAVGVLLLGFFAAPDKPFLAVTAFLVVLIGAVAYSLTVVKQAGPICKHIDDGSITLAIPSEEAAEAIESRLGTGAAASAPVPGSGGPASREAEDELDRKLQAELDLMP